MIDTRAALAGLRVGQVTEDTRRLVTASAKALVRTGRYTTPSGGRAWSSYDIDDLAADFLGSPERLVALATTATDDAHLKFLVQRGLERLVIDRLRATPRGVLRRRIERRVGNRPDIEKVVPNHWALEPYAAAVHWGGASDVLIAAANAVAVDPPPAWSEDSPRQPPATTGRSIDTLCTAVLDAAAAPVERPLVVTVVSERVMPIEMDHVVDAGSVIEPQSQSAEEAVLDAADRLAAAEVAERIWALMNDDERALLPFIGEPSRHVAEAGVLGLGKSAIEVRQKKLRASLADVLHGVPDLTLLMGRLLELCEQRAASGQVQGGAP